MSSVLDIQPTVEDFAIGGAFSWETDDDKFLIIQHSDLDKSQQLSLLKSIKIDLNNHLRDNGMPLFYYALENYYSPASDVKSVFKSFIESGANVNVRNRAGVPLLHMYIDNDANSHSKDIIEFLLENGAGIYAEWIHGTPPQHADIFEKVIDSIEDNDDIDIFMNIVKLLIDHIDINHRFRSERTILMIAIICDEFPLDIIEYIIKAGADVQLKDKFNATALHYLTECTTNVVDVMRLLIANGADVNAINTRDHGNSPLMMAIEHIRNNSVFDAVKLLILAGADVNHKNSQGQTALSVACHKHTLYKHMSNVILRLIDAGAVIEHEYNVSSKILMVVLNDLRQTQNKLFNTKKDFSNTIVAFATRESLKKRQHDDTDA